MGVDSVETIDCKDEFCIANVSEFKGNIEKLLASSNKIIVDVSKIERIDSAAMQLLFALYKQAVSGDFKLEFKQPSEAFRSAVKERGLEELLA